MEGYSRKFCCTSQPILSLIKPACRSYFQQPINQMTELRSDTSHLRPECQCLGLDQGLMITVPNRSAANHRSHLLEQLDLASTSGGARAITEKKLRAAQGPSDTMRGRIAGPLLRMSLLLLRVSNDPFAWKMFSPQRPLLHYGSVN